jgi:hypothetical protein
VSLSPFLDEILRLTTHASIKPSNYDLSLSNLEFGGDWSYDGIVKIESDVKTSTDEIVLNVKHLEIKDVDVLDDQAGCT